MDTKNNPKIQLLLVAGAGTATASTSLIAFESQPVFAAVPTDVTTAVTDIQGTMTALGGLATGALAVVLTVLGIYYAIRYGKKVMSQG